MDVASPKGKILRGTEGLGTVTPQLVEERAREIARSDGREQPNDLDLTRARRTNRCYIELGEVRNEGGTGSGLGNATGVLGREGSDGAP